MTRIAEDRLLAFDVGLSGIHRAPDMAPLPDEGIAPAIDTRPVLALEALFASPTADDMMLAAAEPQLTARAVLEPATYGAALAGARGLLLDRAAAAEGALRQVFADALTVVEAALEDRALLDRSRLALLRG